MLFTSSSDGTTVTPTPDNDTDPTNGTDPDNSTDLNPSPETGAQCTVMKTVFHMQ